MVNLTTPQIAIIGAGPAGLFAAERLAQQGFEILLFNRDIKPGGLAEYGIFPDKHKLKNGLRKQFDRILTMENIHYAGNVSIGKNGCIQIADLMEWGFAAILITCGAQGTKWLGIPGEKINSVYHAKDIVYHYNKLPPFSSQKFKIGKKVAIVGAGNVMTDIAHYLVQYKEVDEIYVIARRGPAEVKFEKKELEPIINYFDLPDLDEEFDRVSPLMRSLGQDPQAAKDFILSAREKAYPCKSSANIKMRFLLSPKEIIPDENNRVGQLVMEENTLESRDQQIHPRGLGLRKTLQVDTVIFAIGDRVDDELGLPVLYHEYRKAQKPAFPVEGLSYEIEDPLTKKPLPGIFVGGWARHASSGLVGLARKDGDNAAVAMINYIELNPPKKVFSYQDVIARISTLVCPVVDKESIMQLEAAEKAEAQRLGLEDYKFSTNEEMLKAMGIN